MHTIQAMVNPRLLSKANRLFTGTLEGRIIEVLQNARRGGATEVEITNEDEMVIVHDNGRGIDDFARLLDLGGSSWEEAFEASEDPAGVGLFCLAPRDLEIRSNGKRVRITGDGWTGTPVAVQDDPDPVKGTTLRFEDDEWTREAVQLQAVFTSLQVTVDGQTCPSLPFLSKRAAHYPELGCRIEVCEYSRLSNWHQSCHRGTYRGWNALVNFHGQVVSFAYHLISEHSLHYLIDLTGEPTGIRLMLPARTQLVENEAYKQLKQALEVEAYRYLQRQGDHRLPYKEYLRAKELGVELPEAKPVYSAGLLCNYDPPEPVEVAMPKDFPLTKCYRFDPDYPGGDESDEANVHLLAALGTFEPPFVPVSIHQKYNGYSWAELPEIGKVELKVGKTLHSSMVCAATLTCVDSLTVTAHASNGQVFSSAVCLAVTREAPPESPDWVSDHVLVTPEAQHRLLPSEIWCHCGGSTTTGIPTTRSSIRLKRNSRAFGLT